MNLIEQVAHLLARGYDVARLLDDALTPERRRQLAREALANHEHRCRLCSPVHLCEGAKRLHRLASDRTD